VHQGTGVYKVSWPAATFGQVRPIIAVTPLFGRTLNVAVLSFDPSGVNDGYFVVAFTDSGTATDSPFQFLVVPAS
jgi:hypothetical protein